MAKILMKIILLFKNVFYKKKTATVDIEITEDIIEKINALTDEMVEVKSKAPFIVDKIYFFPCFPTTDYILDLLTDLDKFIENVDLLCKRASDLDFNCYLLMDLQNKTKYFNYIKREIEGKYLGSIINRGLYR